jgi:hypothetical protein
MPRKRPRTKAAKKRAIKQKQERTINSLTLQALFTSEM